MNKTSGIKKGLLAAVIAGCLLLVSGLPLRADFDGDFDIESNEDLRAELRYEMEQSREAEFTIQSQVAETRRAERRLGKDLTDVHGNRVRVEQYVKRTAHNAYRFLVFNTRKDLNRVDYGYMERTFNKTLPEDISFILRCNLGLLSINANPEYWVAQYEGKIANSFGDYHVWTGEDGQVVSYSKPIGTVYETVFGKETMSVGTRLGGKVDKITIYRTELNSGFNNKGKISMQFPGANSLLGVGWTDDNKDGIMDIAEVDTNYFPTHIVELQDPFRAHDYHAIRFVDGTIIARSELIINKEGRILPRRSILLGNLDMTGLPNTFRETICAATEFGGRTIDLVRTYVPLRLCLSALCLATE